MSERRTLKPRDLPGLAKPISPVALGFEFFEDLEGARPLLDSFVEAGGNLLDTAHIYGLGTTETVLGEWLAGSGVRDDCVIIGKGAHSPDCHPEAVSQQLDLSLERMNTDYIDIYFLHRDNPDVPVGEFVDAMDAEVRAGRIRGPVGGSNWTMERMEAAIDYARQNGKQAPGVLSNNFALAEMLHPIWPGCVSASGASWRRWLSERQMPNFAWSSQARGFFTERAGRDKTEDAELVNTWYSEENFARRDRAVALAEKLGRSPIHIALAYVLAQPFPSIPLVGPRTLEELADSLSALDLALSPEDAAWLADG